MKKCVVLFLIFVMVLTLAAILEREYEQQEQLEALKVHELTAIDN